MQNFFQHYTLEKQNPNKTPKQMKAGLIALFSILSKPESGLLLAKYH